MAHDDDGALRSRSYQPGCDQQVKLRYSAEELALVTHAATSAGLTPSGYAAEATLAAAQGVDAPSVLPLRAGLVELMAARTQVRRLAVNVNQAVKAFNATGRAPEWLAAAIAITERAVTHLDDAAIDVARAVRRRPPDTDGEALRALQSGVPSTGRGTP